jgi:hypothetical protein
VGAVRVVPRAPSGHEPLLPPPCGHELGGFQPAAGCATVVAARSVLPQPPAGGTPTRPYPVPFARSGAPNRPSCPHRLFPDHWPVAGCSRSSSRPFGARLPPRVVPGPPAGGGLLAQFPAPLRGTNPPLPPPRGNELGGFRPAAGCATVVACRAVPRAPVWHPPPPRRPLGCPTTAPTQASERGHYPRRSVNPATPPTLVRWRWAREGPEGWGSEKTACICEPPGS